MAALLLALVLLSSCATPTVMMVHPGSGQTVMCRSAGIGIIPAVTAEISVHKCVDQARAAGFVKADEYGRYNQNYYQNPYRGWKR